MLFGPVARARRIGLDQLTNMSINIYDVEAALEKTFKGCTARVPDSLGGHHILLKFIEYEIRVILSGSPAKPTIHFRFTQRVVPKKGQKPIRVLINEVRTTKPDDLLTAIRDAKEYLLGISQAIQQVLKPKPVPMTRGVGDLL